MDDFTWTEKEIDLVSEGMGHELTRAEIISLAHAARGLSTKEEASELGLSFAEVQRRRRQLLDKLGRHSMAEAVALLKGGPQARVRVTEPGPRSRLSHLAERVLA